MRKFIQLHRFFMQESKKYIGVFIPMWTDSFSGKTFGRYEYKLKHKIYFPIAYIKFMFFSFTK